VAHTGNDSAGIEYGCYVMTGTTSGTLTPDVTPATCPGMALPYTLLSPYVVEAFALVAIRIVPN